ncbi:FRG domain protein [compost metagenome]
MREFNTRSLEEFLKTPLWDSHTMIFRGVSKASYELAPSIARVPAKDEKSRVEFEQEIFEEFQKRAVPFLENEPKSRMEWLFLAQHYGIPTRLLDWTTNPLVALFFATEKNNEHDFAVYKRLQSEWVSGDIDPFEIREEYGLKPRHSDIRYVNQAGVFTIHPAHSVECSGDSIAKYTFPRAIKEEIRWRLGKYGIKTSFIYPNLNGISKDILEECKTRLNGGSMRSTSPFDWA